MVWSAGVITQDYKLHYTSQQVYLQNTHLTQATMQQHAAPLVAQFVVSNRALLTTARTAIYYTRRLNTRSTPTK